MNKCECCHDVYTLEDLGIALYDAHGYIKPLSEVMAELKEAYHKVNPGTEQSLTKEIREIRNELRSINTKLNKLNVCDNDKPQSLGIEKA